MFPIIATADLLKLLREQQAHAIIRNATRCLVGDKCSANTFPYIEVGNASSQVEHEASTSKMNEEQLFYFQVARHFERRCDQYDRQWILQRCYQ